MAAAGVAVVVVLAVEVVDAVAESMIIVDVVPLPGAGWAEDLVLRVLVGERRRDGHEGAYGSVGYSLAGGEDAGVEKDGTGCDAEGEKEEDLQDCGDGDWVLHA